MPGDTPTPNTRQPFFYGHLLVVAAFLIMVVMWGLYYSFGVFFNPLLSEFSWTRTMISGAFSLSAVMTGLLAIATGRLTDKYGSRIVMTICAIFLGLGFVLMSKTSAVWQIYLFFGVIVGTGMAGAFVPLMSTVARWFVEKRSTMTGIVTTGISVGTMVGPPLAHRLISAYGWRMSYVLMGSLALAAVLIAQILKHDPSRVGQLPYGRHGEQPQETGLYTEGLSLNESIRSAQFWIVFSVFFCLGFCVFAIIVHITPHAIERGISPAMAANILATIGGMNIVGRVVLGRVADIIGNKKAFILGFILMSTALLFGVIPVRLVWILFLCAGVFGLANGTCVASQSPLVAEIFGLNSHGVILGFLACGFTLGGAIGPFLAGYIFDIKQSYALAFLVCAGISLVGLALSGLLKTGSR
jgi:MFS family permease